MKRSLLSIVLSLLGFGAFAQCMLYPVNLSSRLSQSDLIVHAQVLNEISFYNEAGNYIYTSHVLQINSILKGQSPQLIELITDGGLIGLKKQVVEPSLQVQEGNEGVFMLRSSNHESQFGRPVYVAVCDQQGFIRFDHSDNKAYEPFHTYQGLNQELKTVLEKELHHSISDFLSPDQSAKFSSNSSVASVTGISPTTITAGTFSVLTISGSGFGATQGTSIVEFKNADDGGATFIQPHSSEYVSWSNTQIQVMVPTRASTVSGTAGTGQVRVTVAGSPTLSAQTLTVNHGEINVHYPTTNKIYNTRHVDLNANGGITWQMYTGFNSSSAKAPFIRAFDTWRCNTLINWKLGLAVSTNTIAGDGVNVIRFDVGSELPGGVLGRCSSYFNGCVSGPNVFFFISELDICFDDATNWQYGPANATGSQFDFESVAVHELGHGHQLSHVINTNDFMHYSIAPAQNKRTMVATNLAGGQNVMSRNTSGGVCLKPAMVALAAGQCSLVAPTASFNVTPSICVGSFLTLTDLSTNGPTNWSWTMTGGSITTATTQNTSTSYGTLGNYTISLVASNGVGSSSTLSKTVQVVAIPNVVVTSNTMCAGTSATIQSSGASTFTWMPGNLSGNLQTVSPASTQIYTVTGSNGTCTNTANGTVTVIANPVVVINNAAICVGSSTVMNASGATTYTWNPGNLSGSTQNLSPASTAVYTVNGKTGSCVSAPKLFTITVTNIPTITTAASPTAICAGQTTTITSSGASSFSSNPGNGTGTTMVLSPTVNTTYTITGTTSNCASTNTVAVMVSPCTEIGELSGDEFFSVFPNPVKDKLNVSFKADFDGTVTLYNAIGQLIMNAKVKGRSTELNLSEQASGIYILRISSDDAHQSVIRFIK